MGYYNRDTHYNREDNYYYILINICNHLQWRNLLLQKHRLFWFYFAEISIWYACWVVSRMCSAFFYFSVYLFFYFSLLYFPRRPPHQKHIFTWWLFVLVSLNNIFAIYIWSHIGSRCVCIYIILYGSYKHKNLCLYLWHICTYRTCLWVFVIVCAGVSCLSVYEQFFVYVCIIGFCLWQPVKILWYVAIAVSNKERFSNISWETKIILFLLLNYTFRQMYLYWKQK